MESYGRDQVVLCPRTASLAMEERALRPRYFYELIILPQRLFKRLGLEVVSPNTERWNLWLIGHRNPCTRDGQMVEYYCFG